MNFLKARLAAGDGSLAVVPEGGPPLPLPRALAARYTAYTGQKVVLGIRPEHITNIWSDHQSHALAPLEVVVEIAEPLGADTLVFSRIGETEIVSRVSRNPVVSGSG